MKAESGKKKVSGSGTAGIGASGGEAVMSRTHPAAGALALIGVMAAVMCVMGPVTVPIPVSPVPISLTNLAVFIAVYVLGTKKALVSCLVYLLIGFVGLPVFSGFSGGPAKLLGPTGGYLIGFVFMALVSGVFIERFWGRRMMGVLGMAIGSLVCYLFGTVWLAYQAKMTFAAALAAGVLPFLPGDLAKIVLAAAIGPQIRERLRKAGI